MFGSLDPRARPGLLFIYYYYRDEVGTKEGGSAKRREKVEKGKRERKRKRGEKKRELSNNR
jgi:hypothetical protein